MPVRRIGLSFDGSCGHVTIGKTEIPFISESHGDNLKAEWVWRLGTQTPEADTPGQYEPEEGSLKMSSVNFRSLLVPALARIGAGNTRRIAIVTLTHPEIGTDSDALEGFRVMGLKQAIEASSKSIEIEVKTRYRLVRWGEKRMCLGNPTGTGAVGTVRI